MTTPVVTPSKMKSVWALVGSLFAALVPLALQFSSVLPPPWPALIGGFIALLTMLGVYHAPYKPAGTVLVPDAAPPAEPPAGGWKSPWK